MTRPRRPAPPPLEANDRRVTVIGTAGWAAALATLERHGAMTPGELAEHEKVQPPSMTRVIAALADWDLVARAPDPTDRRQVILSVTSSGRELVQQVRRRREAWLARRLAELTPQERAALLAAAPILEKLSQA